MQTDKPDNAAVEATILRLAAEVPGKTISPTDVARSLAPDGDWHLMMHVVRRAAIRLAHNGQLTIYRKGKPVDPDDFKGVYRLGLPRPH